MSTDYQISTERFDTMYHVCQPNNTIPMGDGEKIVKGCRCIEEFAEAASIMAVLGEAGKDMSCPGDRAATGECVGEIRIFGGRGRECPQNGWDTTFFNCCNDDEGSFPFLKEHCPEESIATVQAKQAGRAHFIGTYCKKEVKPIGCVQKADVYRISNSRMGRIIQEQGRTQPRRHVPDGNWGTTNAPDCDGLTPEEFQMLDFSRIDMKELFGDMIPAALPVVMVHGMHPTRLVRATLPSLSPYFHPNKKGATERNL